MARQSWRDNNGREWAIILDVNAIKRVRVLLGVDLLNLVSAGADLLGRLDSDPVFLCDVAYAVCKPDADRAGVTDEMFGSAFPPDGTEQVFSAIVEAIICFFPMAKRPAIRAVVEKRLRLRDRLIDLAAAKIETVNVEAIAEEAMRLIDQLPPAFGEKSGSLPASSESTPAL